MSKAFLATAAKNRSHWQKNTASLSVGVYRGKRKIQGGRVEVEAALRGLYGRHLAQPGAQVLLPPPARRRQTRPPRPGRCHAQAADHPQRQPARSAALGTCPELSVEAMAATPAAARAGSRPQAAAGEGTTAPALNRRSPRPTLQPPPRPLTFKTVAPSLNEAGRADRPGLVASFVTSSRRPYVNQFTRRCCFDRSVVRPPAEKTDLGLRGFCL